MKHLLSFFICFLLISCNHKQGLEEPEEPCNIPEGFCDGFPKIGWSCHWNPAWDYPVKPGMEEWGNQNSREKKVAVCQIPEDILYSLSVEDLTVICLQYPLLADVFAFNNMDFAINRMFEEFNGIRYLFTKNDVSKELLKHYLCVMNNFSIFDSDVSELEKGLFIISISEIEILLSCYNSQNKDAIENSKEILRHLLCGYEKKMEYPNYFSGHGYKINFFARAKMINYISPENVNELFNNYRLMFLSGDYSQEMLEIHKRFTCEIFK